MVTMGVTTTTRFRTGAAGQQASTSMRCLPWLNSAASVRRELPSRDARTVGARCRPNDAGVEVDEAHRAVGAAGEHGVVVGAERGAIRFDRHAGDQIQRARVEDLRRFLRARDHQPPAVVRRHQIDVLQRTAADDAPAPEPTAGGGVEALD